MIRVNRGAPSMTTRVVAAGCAQHQSVLDHHRLRWSVVASAAAGSGPPPPPRGHQLIVTSPTWMPQAETGPKRTSTARVAAGSAPLVMVRVVHPLVVATAAVAVVGTAVSIPEASSATIVIADGGCEKWKVVRVTTLPGAASHRIHPAALLLRLNRAASPAMFDSGPVVSMTMFADRAVLMLQSAAGSNSAGAGDGGAASWKPREGAAVGETALPKKSRSPLADCTAPLEIAGIQPSACTRSPRRSRHPSSPERRTGIGGDLRRVRRLTHRMVPREEVRREDRVRP